MNLNKSYLNFCKKKNFEINKNQLHLVKELDNFYNINFNKSFLKKILNQKKSKLGFYLHGDVGVGKTMILNFFFDQVDEKKIRLHFNEFMLSFHDFVHERKEKSEENVINHFVKELKSKASLIYFDEFQVTNIVDAMILGKLFDQIFKENIKVLVTSNTKISELYKDGLQRDQFKPFIKIMEEQSIEYELKIEDDYRKSNNNKVQRYFYPLTQETNFRINKFFRTITKNKYQSSISVNIKGRDFVIDNFYDGIARFNFNILCNQNLGAEDYLKIIQKCKFIVLEEIPQFNDSNSNQQKRFITLLDIIYDKDIPIAVTADQNIEKFTSSRLLEEPFKRTISRLYELTSKVKN
jgi:cell division protein ZapE